MMKTATAKKATKTAPTSNCTNPSQWHQCELDPMWLIQCHVTMKKHQAAANHVRKLIA
jgi:hypothetical protein